MNTKLLWALGFFLLSLSGFAQNNPNVVDFENGTYGGTHTAGPETGPINNAYFNSAYGVQFFNFVGATYYTPKYAQIGSPAAAFLTTNTTSPYCVSGSTADDNPFASTTNPGCWFMTDDVVGASGNPKPLRIEYDQTAIQCTIASGYIFDLDGSSMAEAWQIDIYSTTSGGTPDNSIYLISDQYASCSGCPALPGPQSGAYNYGPPIDAGDGDDTYWELQTNGDPIDYIIMTYIGHTSRNVGVSFDNFYYCSKGDTTPPPGPCDGLDANFSYQVEGCGVQFFDQTSNTTGNPIIGWHWTFGDGNSSNQQNPFHQFAPNNTYNVSLEVTTWDGEKCCTDTIMYEVSVEDCRECEADIDFTWSYNELCDPCLIDFSAIINYQTTGVIGYYWNIDGNIYTGPNVQYYVNGVASVCLTIIFEDPSGEPGACCSRTICAEVECGTSGNASGGGPKGMMLDPTDDGESTLDAQDQSELKSTQTVANRIYPNPSNTEIFVDLEAYGNESVVVELISTNGQRIELNNDVTLHNGNNHMKFNTSTIPEGMYILRIKGEHTNFSERLHIQH